MLRLFDNYYFFYILSFTHKVQNHKILQFFAIAQCSLFATAAN